MGYLKNKMIEEYDRGWSSIDKNVCANCIEDDDLKEFIIEHASSTRCDYCSRHSRKKPIAVAMDELLEEISEAVNSIWDHPDNVGIAYESREGGYQASVFDSYDLVYDELGSPFIPEELSKDIIGAFAAGGDLWVEKHFYTSPPDGVLKYGWGKFVNVVKHRKRYLFSVAEPTPSDDIFGEDLPPDKFLSAFGSVITEVGLVRTLPANTAIYRARVHQANEFPKSAADLGTAPLETSKYSNRMSPAGIPMFYGAFDRETAIVETFDPSKGHNVSITIGRFTTAREIPVLDLTKIPAIPGLFNSAARESRDSLRFLHDMLADLSAPVSKDGREHIDYVPTQIIAEYIRHCYKHPIHGMVRGIIYKSVKERGKTCCVLFFESESCCDTPNGWKSAMTDYPPTQPKWWLGLYRQGVKRLSAPPAWAIETQI